MIINWFGKALRKNRSENSQLKMPHVNRRSEFLCKHLVFCSYSCFGLATITPIWLQKSWNCVSRSKKNSAPIQFKIIWIVKNQEHRNIATLNLFIGFINTKKFSFWSQKTLKILSSKLPNRYSKTNLKPLQCPCRVSLQNWLAYCFWCTAKFLENQKISGCISIFWKVNLKNKRGKKRIL